MQLKAYFLQILGEFTDCEEPSVTLSFVSLNFIARMLLFFCDCYRNVLNYFCSTYCTSCISVFAELFSCTIFIASLIGNRVF